MKTAAAAEVNYSIRRINVRMERERRREPVRLQALSAAKGYRVFSFSDNGTRFGMNIGEVVIETSYSDTVGGEEGGGGGGCCLSVRSVSQ